MIHLKEVTPEYISQSQEFLKEVQNCIVKGFQTIPLYTSTEQTRQQAGVQNIIKELMNKFPDMEVITQIPSLFLQLLFPKKNLVINALFIKDKVNLSIKLFEVEEDPDTLQ